MSQFNQGAVAEIPTDAEDVYAFRIDGEVDEDTMEALAAHMNRAFDGHDSVNMLFDLSGYEGADTGLMFNAEALKSRLRALSHVDKYAVIGAPDAAAQMISIMDKVIPVEARAFDVAESDAAWTFVGARPADAR